MAEFLRWRKTSVHQDVILSCANLIYLSDHTNIVVQISKQEQVETQLREASGFFGCFQIFRDQPMQYFQVQNVLTSVRIKLNNETGGLIWHAFL